MSEECQNCRFFRVIPADMKKGLCCKSPPQPFLVPDGNSISLNGFQPPVSRTDYCGEFKPKLSS